MGWGEDAKVGPDERFCIRTCIIGNADLACFVSILFVQLMFDPDQESGRCFILFFILFTMVLFL